ncbi:MAG TPA: SpoIIE family protein phosphatase [Candidatus Polarisedimenticolaceae bacterium]|nr:SpoIIE family protein phosphatase [Candidatus Polarisedimenticolaceae bacterium]
MALPDRFRALIADDEPAVREALRLLLKGAGCQIEAVGSPAAVLRELREHDYDVLLMDLNYARQRTSGEEGLALLEQVRGLDPTLPVVALTGWGSDDLAVESLRRGVRDFVRKPWTNDELLGILREKVAAGRSLRSQRGRLRQGGHGWIWTQPPILENYEIALAWRPARRLGGDLLGAFRMDRHTLALCIADVEGNGLPAALAGSTLQAAIETALREDATPAEVCARANRLLCRGHGAAGKLATCFIGLLDLDRRRLRYANAGHPAPFLLRARAGHARLAAGGGVLGAFPDWTYDEAEIGLEAHDRLLLFTDGVTEAGALSGDEFGEGRLLILGAEASGDAQSLVDEVMDAVEGHGALSDDAALLALHVA